MKQRNIALVTGGAVRLGKGIAQALAEAGYDIVLHYHRSVDEVEATLSDIRATGVRARGLPMDFGRPAEVEDHWNQLPEEWIPNVLINNASIFADTGMHDAGHMSLEAHMAINFTTPYLLTKLFSRSRSAGGSIINILDTRINRYDESHMDYALSKKLLAEFTRISAKVLGPGIRVNGIAPGLILPPPGASRDYLEVRAKDIPLRRIGDMDAITQSVLFLLSNHFITGQILYVDGGEHLNY